jgi:hypothetical protein
VAHIVHYFKDADMRCAHHGLSVLAKKHKHSVETLKSGEFLLFVNARQTIAKVLGAGGVILHLKSENGRIDFRTLRYLPQLFSGKHFTYNDALSKVIEEDFRARSNR